MDLELVDFGQLECTESTSVVTALTASCLRSFRLEIPKTQPVIYTLWEVHVGGLVWAEKPSWRMTTVPFLLETILGIASLRIGRVVYHMSLAAILVTHVSSIRNTIRDVYRPATYESRSRDSIYGFAGNTIARTLMITRFLHSKNDTFAGH